ncbi:MAG: N-acetyltransferase family protein [Candidatus Limnocylindrales bacterium]
MAPSPAGALTLRLADPERDAAAMAAIYEPHVTTGLASFEAVAPDRHEMATRLARGARWAPWLVAAAPAGDQRVAGYAYAARHAERAGYRWDVNLSVYIAPEWQGQGIGRRLYDALVPILRIQRFLNAYAGIALPNPGSVRLHEAIGMRHLATYERVGWKQGAWLDVAWLHMPLATEFPNPPPEPIALPDLLADPTTAARVHAILGS